MLIATTAHKEYKNQKKNCDRTRTWNERLLLLVYLLKALRCTSIAHATTIVNAPLIQRHTSHCRPLYNVLAPSVYDASLQPFRPPCFCITPFFALFIFVRISILQLCQNSHSTLVIVVGMSFCNIQRSLPFHNCYRQTYKAWIYIWHSFRSETKSNKYRTNTKLFEVYRDSYPI